jgi:glycine hydroxymethyltransferase
MQGGPLMHVIAAKAVAFLEAMKPEFIDYQRRVLENAATLADELKKAGFRLVSGGTDNHLVLVDLASTGVNGKQAEESLGRAGIVVNRNTVPFTNGHSARVTGGMRLGTPAVTTRGFGIEEMKTVSRLIVKIISHIDEPIVEQEVHDEVQNICARFSVPGVDD